MKNPPDFSSMLVAVAMLSVCVLPFVPLNATAQSVAATFPPDESFDEVTPPVLPSGWETIGWVTTGITPGSAPNAAFADDPDVVTDKSLFAPPVTMVANAKLKFRHQIDLDSSGPGSAVTFDGVVLEVAIFPNGPFFDIFDAGGSFASGGYDHVVFASSGNPLAGRAAWGGVTHGYQNVVVNLPAPLIGCPVYLRWRMGTDNFVAGAGYWLDDVHVDVTPPIFADDFEVRALACQ